MKAGTDGNICLSHSISLCLCHGLRVLREASSAPEEGKKKNERVKTDALAHSHNIFYIILIDT